MRDKERFLHCLIAFQLKGPKLFNFLSIKTQVAELIEFIQVLICVKQIVLQTTQLVLGLLIATLIVA